MWGVASAMLVWFSGRSSRHSDVIVLYRERASQSASILAGRCSTVKWYMRSAARHRCRTCVAACSLSGSSSKKPFKPWESAIHVNSAPRRCLRHLLNAHIPTEASPVCEWYDCSAGVVALEMHETALSLMPCVCSSKRHGPPLASNFSAGQNRHHF